MVKVIGVRFRTAGKIYFFDPLQFEIKRDDHVIVETARGIEFGTVVTGATEVAEEKVVQPLKPVIRIANKRDMEQEAANREKEKEAYRICLEKIHSHGLEMKLIDAEYTFDNNKVLFYFTADGRIDFRELVKDLAGVFKTRIELRQIGVRDETKLVGGIGICGRALCCHSYLADFVPVSIKMAKEQNLSLNPAKISGVCGRLMCCLKNEEETYEELNRRLPNIGDYVTIEGGLKGEVQSVNVLRQLVKVVVDAGDEKEIKEYPVEKLHFKRKHSKKEKMELSPEELEELERLEEEEKQKKEQTGSSEDEKRQGGKGKQNQSGGKNSGQRSEEGRRQGQKVEDCRRQGAGEEGRRQGFGGEDSRRQGFNGEDSRRQGFGGEDARRQGIGEDSRRQGFNREDSRREGFGSDEGRRQNHRGEDSRRTESRGQAQTGANMQEQSDKRGESRNQGRHEEEGRGRYLQGQRAEENRRQSQRTHGGSRQSGQRYDRVSARMEAGEDYDQMMERYQGGKKRRDNRKHQDKKWRRNGQQDNSDFQGGRNRYENRNRNESREPQE